MTINGIAIIIWLVNCVVIGVTCYLWGRSSGSSCPDVGAGADDPDNN